MGAFSILPTSTLLTKIITQNVWGIIEVKKKKLFINKCLEILLENSSTIIGVRTDLGYVSKLLHPSSTHQRIMRQADPLNEEEVLNQRKHI